jgi:hypothetical protein
MDLIEVPVPRMNAVLELCANSLGGWIDSRSAELDHDRSDVGGKEPHAFVPLLRPICCVAIGEDPTQVREQVRQHRAGAAKLSGRLGNRGRRTSSVSEECLAGLPQAFSIVCRR